ncbi:MAG TPA: hypothetical protein VGQ05_13975 [Streptosporangiaceae bacterium]|jgi:hypothetical protein|nr:hypothetical protein [Streptosporangiaceae bacterium]
MVNSSLNGASRKAGWLGRGGLWAAAAGVAVLATGGVALASDSTSVSGQIRACYRPGSNPSQLKVLTGAGSHCPHGYQTLTWNITGPKGPIGPKGATGPKGTAGPQGAAGAQGPAGLSTGTTVDSNRFVSIDQGPGHEVTVLTGLPAPVSGVYYLTASLSIRSFEGDEVGCLFAPDPRRTSSQLVQPAGSAIVSLSLTGAVTLDAGQRPSIICFDSRQTSETKTIDANLNAVLINSSTSGTSSGTSSATTGHGAS